MLTFNRADMYTGSLHNFKGFIKNNNNSYVNYDNNDQLTNDIHTFFRYISTMLAISLYR